MLIVSTLMFRFQSQSQKVAGLPPTPVEAGAPDAWGRLSETDTRRPSRADAAPGGSYCTGLTRPPLGRAQRVQAQTCAVSTAHFGGGGEP